MNDVRKMIYGTIIGFFMMLGFWFSIIYISSCGFTFTCHRADLKVNRTPIPTLIPSSPENVMDMMNVGKFDSCQVYAADFVGAWVEAGAPETDPFPFTDVNGQECIGTFDEVQPLFSDNGTWQMSSLGCVSCHNADLTERSAGLDLSSYQAITSSDVLGSNWESSTLHDFLGMGLSPDGHSSDVPAGNPLIFVGAVSAASDEAAQ